MVVLFPAFFVLAGFSALVHGILQAQRTLRASRLGEADEGAFFSVERDPMCAGEKTAALLGSSNTLSMPMARRARELSPRPKRRPGISTKWALPSTQCIRRSSELRFPPDPMDWQSSQNIIEHLFTTRPEVGASLRVLPRNKTPTQVATIQ